MKSWMKVVSIFAVMLMLAGCSLFSGNDEKQDKGGVINFSIHNSFDSRIIEPDLDVIPGSYRVIGNGPNGRSFDEVVSNSEFKIQYLVFGNWQITVEVRNASGYVFARGSGSTMVNVGEESNLEIKTTMLQGNGTLNLTFTYPVAEVQSPNVELSLVDNTGSIINLVTVDGGINNGAQTLNVSGLPLSSGYYTLIAQVIDLGASGTQNHIAMGAAEVVRIIQDQTTSGQIDLTGVIGTGSIVMSIVNDFNERIPATIAGTSPSSTVFDINSNTEITLTGSIPADDEDISNVTYTWFINGELISTGSNFIIDSNNCPLNQNRDGQYLPGDYRVDMLVFNSDGSRGGSAIYEFGVSGSPVIINTIEKGSINGVVGFMSSGANGLTTFTPLSGVTVLSGNESVTTGTNGTFNLTEVNEGRAVVSLSANGYMANNKSVNVLANQSTDLERVVLLPSETYTFDSTIGNSYTTNNGIASITFNADSIEDNSGNPYNGTVTVNTSAVDPSFPGFLETFPGGFTGVTSGGDSVDIISFGVVNVELEDLNGNPLKLRQGSTAEISMAVEDPASAPSALPLWHLDTATGNWVEEGSAVLVGNNYVGDVTHFTSWNFDYPVPEGEDERYSRQPLSGRVIDENGDPVPNAQVVFSGMSDLAWETILTTDNNGIFSNVVVYVDKADTAPIYSGYAIKDGKKSNTEIIEVTNNSSNIVFELRNPTVDITVKGQRGLNDIKIENQGAYLRFGNTTTDIFITISNEDANGLEISGITFNGSGASSFSVVTPVTYPITLNNGSSQSFIVRFTYDENLGSVIGEMVISSNCSSEPDYRIRIEGGSDLNQT